MGAVSTQGRAFEKAFQELLRLIDFDIEVLPEVTVLLHDFEHADGSEILIEDDGELLIL